MAPLKLLSYSVTCMETDLVYLVTGGIPAILIYKDGISKLCVISSCQYHLKGDIIPLCNNIVSSKISEMMGLSACFFKVL